MRETGEQEEEEEEPRVVISHHQMAGHWSVLFFLPSGGIGYSDCWRDVGRGRAGQGRS